MAHKRLNRREKQRIKTTVQKHGSDAFSKFGRKGGRPRK